MKTLFALVVLASSLVPVGAWAAEGIPIRTNTAGELAELCGTNPRAPGADAKINFCHGFAQGAIDVARRQLTDKRLFCFPSSVPTRAATMNEFVAWVRAMPDRGALPSTDGLFKFLGERFPCK